MTAGHVPARPSWDCQACGCPWPCDPAREERAGDPTLSIYLSLQLADAASDMPWAPPGELWERFVAWTRPQPSAANGDWISGLN
jgi:hypothetical protein